MALPEEPRAGQQNLLASGSCEIRESCSRVPPVSWEVPGGAGKALVHFWAEHCNPKRLAILELKATENQTCRCKLPITGRASAVIKRMAIWRATDIFPESSCRRLPRSCSAWIRLAFLTNRSRI
jgi:hypothetical protein